MGREDLPILLIEVLLVFGGVLLFAWWQLRSVARDRKKSATSARPVHPRAPDAGPVPPSDPL